MIIILLMVLGCVFLYQIRNKVVGLPRMRERDKINVCPPPLWAKVIGMFIFIMPLAALMFWLLVQEK